jgi:SHS2 domain-containing protein
MNDINRSYELIEHTADCGMRVFGSDITDLYKNAAFAMYDVMVETEKKAPDFTETIEVEGYDRPDLLINWLRELIYYWHVKERILVSVDIRFISEQRIEAEAGFIGFDPETSVLKTELKAVTYHQVDVKKKPRGFEATVIFDV